MVSGLDVLHGSHAIGCTVVQALAESAFGPGGETQLSLTAFERYPSAAAVFVRGEERPRAANPSWVELFADTVPLTLREACAEILDASGSRHVSRLAIANGDLPRHAAATVTRLVARPGGSDAVVVVAYEVTDSVIAQELGVEPDVLVWGASRPGQTTYYNGRWRDVCGSNGDGGWTEAIHAEDRASCLEAFGIALDSRGRAAATARLRIRDGLWRWHSIAFVSRGDGWFGMATDAHLVTLAEERAELLERLRVVLAESDRANRLKDEFLAAVSHELRAPVTTLLLWEKVLRDESMNATAHRQALDAIHHCAIAQSRLVGDLLDVSRAISGKLHVDLRTVRLTDVINAALELARPAALMKGVELRCENVAFMCEVSADATRLQQILDNLLSNAIKFTEAGGRVTVSVHTSEQGVEITVEDTGRGIAPHLLTQIFEPFRQANDELARREGGLGLGLAIAKSLAELHGGRLTAASVGVHHGATLMLTLPALRKSSSPTLGIATSTPLREIHVLVIDDDARVREALGILLERAGASVNTASSAAVARTRLATRTPDVIVCDIAMPEEDGCSFIRQLRTTGCDVRAIALTALASEMDVKRALSSGFNVHLSKPINMERLIASISELHVSSSVANFT